MKSDLSKPSRAQLFNYFAASILVVLTSEFPVERNFEEEEFGLVRPGFSDVDDSPFPVNERIEVFYGTLRFLVFEGYVRTPHKPEDLGSYGRMNMSLTLKGLTHLNFRFEDSGLKPKRPLTDALSDALKKPDNWIAVGDLLGKVFN